MTALVVLYKYIGPAFWGLMPISVLTMALVLYVFYSIWSGRKINEWAEILLANFKDISVTLGLLGSVYALTGSFQAEGASSEEIRQKMFFILSTGFWSTIAGVVISLQASVGLMAMKRT